jgi:hypothetical protein
MGKLEAPRWKKEEKLIENGTPTQEGSAGDWAFRWRGLLQ